MSKIDYKKQGKANRNRGYRGETDFRKTLTENGIPTKRKAHPGIKGDIQLCDKDSMEIKFRDSLGDWVWDYIEGVDFLGLKKKHKKKLVVMDIDRFIEMYKKAYVK